MRFISSNSPSNPLVEKYFKTLASDWILLSSWEFRKTVAEVANSYPTRAMTIT